MGGPTGLTQVASARTDGPSDLRVGLVTAVTARGITVAMANGEVSASHASGYAPAAGDAVALMKYRDSWIALCRVVGPGTPTDYSAGGSSAGLAVLAGMRTSGTATLASSSGAAVAVPRYNLTYYHPAGHSVMIMAFFLWGSTQNADWILVDFTELVSATAVGEWVQPLTSASFGRGDTISCLVGDNFGGARRVVSMTMSRLTGTGTTSISCLPSRPGYMIAVDLGDQSVIVPT